MRLRSTGINLDSHSSGGEPILVITGFRRHGERAHPLKMGSLWKSMCKELPDEFTGASAGCSGIRVYSVLPWSSI